MLEPTQKTMKVRSPATKYSWQVIASVSSVAFFIAGVLVAQLLHLW